MLLLSWAPVHKIDFDEIRKTLEGCLLLAFPSKVILMLSEFQSNAKDKPYVAVELVSSGSSMRQIELSEVWKRSRGWPLVSLLSQVIAIFVEF
jgi:hypothetical protein